MAESAGGVFALIQGAVGRSDRLGRGAVAATAPAVTVKSSIVGLSCASCDRSASRRVVPGAAAVCVIVTDDRARRQAPETAADGAPNVRSSPTLRSMFGRRFLVVDKTEEGLKRRQELS